MTPEEHDNLILEIGLENWREDNERNGNIQE